MNIIVKNKFFSFGGGSKVEDEAGNALYRVKGIFLSWTRRKRLVDLNGNVLYKIRNKWPTFLLHSAFICDVDGNKLLKLKQNLRFKHPFVVQDCSDDIQIEGYPLTGMQVTRNGEFLGNIKKEFWALRDYYVLDIPDGQDPTFLIALTVAIDNVHDRARGQSR